MKFARRLDHESNWNKLLVVDLLLDIRIEKEVLRGENRIFVLRVLRLEYRRVIIKAWSLLLLIFAYKFKLYFVAILFCFCFDFFFLGSLFQPAPKAIKWVGAVGLARRVAVLLIVSVQLGVNLEVRQRVIWGRTTMVLLWTFSTILCHFVSLFDSLWETLKWTIHACVVGIILARHFLDSNSVLGI